MYPNTGEQGWISAVQAATVVREISCIGGYRKLSFESSTFCLVAVNLWTLVCFGCRDGSLHPWWFKLCISSNWLQTKFHLHRKHSVPEILPFPVLRHMLGYIARLLGFSICLGVLYLGWCSDISGMFYLQSCSEDWDQSALSNQVNSGGWTGVSYSF